MAARTGPGSRPSRRGLARALVVAVAAVGLWAAVDPGYGKARIYDRQAELMGTTWRLRVAAVPAREAAARQAMAAALTEVARVEGVMSEWDPSSPLSALNRAAGRRAVTVPAELAAILQRSQALSRRSDGAFDVTWRGLGGLWDWSVERFAPPAATAVAAALQRVGYRHLHVTGTTARLDRTGMAVGLGGIAKGYGVDRAAAVLRSHGFRDFLVEGGGDIYAAGRHPARPWRVGIQDPRAPRSRLMASVAVTDLAVVSSGDYERYRMHEGRRYHHILDLRTGWPARKNRHVTVIAPSAELADGLATAVFVLGPEAGLELVARTPAAEALVVGADGRRHVSAGFGRWLAWLGEAGS